MKNDLGEALCACGKTHTASIEEVLVGAGTVRRLPEMLARLGVKRPFLLADVNTHAAAGDAVEAVLEAAGLGYGMYVFPDRALSPDERAVGSAVMHFDRSCDGIVAIGSGVINDIGKLLSCTSERPYIIVATAPSMDGYASASSSMDMDGLKTSLPTRCADVIIGDTDILKNAPLPMLQSGIGDMLAKYVSIAEWRIAHLITGEYYCERVAELIRTAVKKCVDNAEGLLRREPTAVEAVFEGLVIGGIAMTYAGVSRPASGVEHYFSHVWDMRGLEFGTPTELHGTQCAMGTLLAARLYERVKKVRPDRDRALAFAASFDVDAWHGSLRAFLGKGAEAMIALEARERKYDPATHAKRLEIILSSWDAIVGILDEELPCADQIANLLSVLQMPQDPACIGVDRAALQTTFCATKDIRDKYVLSRLAWDLGILDELCRSL